MSDFLARALSALPHGPEFRFLDRLTSLEPGRRGTGEYTLRGDEPFLRGHFPGQPLMPGVLLIEAAAQLAGCIAQSDRATPATGRLKLTALRAVKIFGAPEPGDVIRLEARVTGRLGHLVQAEATVVVGNRNVLQAEMTLSGSTDS